MSHQLKFSAQDVRVLEDEAVFQGYFKVRKLTLKHRQFAGGWNESLSREIFERGDSVGVLPYDPVTDSLVLIEQFRVGALRGDDSPWMLELIAGVLEDEDESPEQLVHREALEEANCELTELLPIASFYPSAGACSEFVQLFCGRVSRAGIGEVHGLDGEGEDILVHSVPRVDALQMLAENRIPNGHTLIALQWLQVHGESLRERWG